MKLKPSRIKICACLLMLSLFYSCKEFIEPSIAKRTVSLKAPGNNYQSTSYTLNFWWDDVEDALQYRLQVVIPKFDSVSALVVDTVIKGTKFAINFEPGEYEWHVRAENGSSQTEFSKGQTFSVVSSNLSTQKASLVSPGDNTLTNQNNAVFKWNALYSATSYRIQIDSNNFADTTHILLNQTIPGQQATFKFPKDQAYQWRVRAENATEKSIWSSINQIIFDTTPPDMTVLLAPDNNAVISKPVGLKWNTVSSAKNYKLYIYKNDTGALYNNTFPLVVSGNSYSFNSGTSGDRVFWQVSAVDEAGNEGALSERRSFTIQ